MLYKVAVSIHILSTIVWVGGMLFLVLVMVPLSRRGMRMPSGEGAILLRRVAERFRPVAWAAILLLVLTGIYIAWEHWGIRPRDFFTDGGHFLQILQIKTGLVILAILLSLIHDFVLGPRVLSGLEDTESAGDPPRPRRARTLLLTLARMNLILALTIIILAVILTRP